jgi:hypothetical protein
MKPPSCAGASRSVPSRLLGWEIADSGAEACKGVVEPADTAIEMPKAAAITIFRTDSFLVSVAKMFFFSWGSIIRAPSSLMKMADCTLELYQCQNKFGWQQIPLH